MENHRDRPHSQPVQTSQGNPIQPSRAKGVEGTIQLAPQFVAGLKDLEGFDRVWLIYWFDRASAAALSVIPYRDVVERGLFSTRAPARVNPLGLSNVKLIEIQGSVLRIGDVDILDDTPLLDIKPYVPAYDNFAVKTIGLDRYGTG